MAAALLLLMHRPLNRIVDEVRSNPLQCLLYGLLALVALIFAAIAALVAGIAFSIGLAAVGLDLLVGTYWLTLVAVALVAAAAVFLIAVFLAPIAVALAATEMTVGRDADMWIRLLVLVVGLLVYTAIAAVPVLGGLLTFLAFLLALGAIALRIRGGNPVRADRPTAGVDIQVTGQV